MDIANNSIQMEGENGQLIHSNMYGENNEINTSKRKLSTDITDILKDSKIPNLDTDNVDMIFNGVDDKDIQEVDLSSSNPETCSNEFTGNILSDAMQMSDILSPEMNFINEDAVVTSGVGESGATTTPAPTPGGGNTQQTNRPSDAFNKPNLVNSHYADYAELPALQTTLKTNGQVIVTGGGGGGVEPNKAGQRSNALCTPVYANPKPSVANSNGQSIAIKPAQIIHTSPQIIQASSHVIQGAVRGRVVNTATAGQRVLLSPSQNSSSLSGGGGGGIRHSPIPAHSLLINNSCNPRVIGQVSRTPSLAPILPAQTSAVRMQLSAPLLAGRKTNSSSLSSSSNSSDSIHSVGRMIPLGCSLSSTSTTSGARRVYSNATTNNNRLANPATNQNSPQIINFNGTPADILAPGKSAKSSASVPMIVDSSGQTVVLPGAATAAASSSAKNQVASQHPQSLLPGPVFHAQLAQRNFHGQPGALPSDPKQQQQQRHRDSSASLLNPGQQLPTGSIVIGPGDLPSQTLSNKPIMNMVINPQTSIPSTIPTTTTSKVNKSNLSRLNPINYHQVTNTQVTMNNGKFQYIRLYPNNNATPSINSGKKITPKYIQPQQPKNTKTHSSQPRFILPVTASPTVVNGAAQLINAQNIVQASNEQVLNPSGQNITQFMLNTQRPINSNLNTGVSLIQNVPPIGDTQVVVTPSDVKSALICKQENSSKDPSYGINAANTATSRPSDSKETLKTGSAPRQKKPCNCNKSQCLKLYCDCFANGEFCQNCNCTNCANNLDNEDVRSRAIKNCLERNPLAFHPKIGKGRGSTTDRRHTKGCNCKRSGCLKNYCECYEAKIMCTSMCKCFGCKNVSPDDVCNSLMHLADAAVVRDRQASMAAAAVSSSSSASTSSSASSATAATSARSTLQPSGSSSLASSALNHCGTLESAMSSSVRGSSTDDVTALNVESSCSVAGGSLSRVSKTSMNLSNIISTMKDRIRQEQDYDVIKQPYSFVNSEVAIAASNCLLARGEEMERLHPGMIHVQEQVILEEFERCIKQLINSASCD